MRLEEYYLSLRAKMNMENAQDRLTASIEELSNAVHCSAKHTKRLLLGFENRGWLTWNRGVGRGNRSTFVFPRHLLDWLDDYLNDCLKTNDITRVMQLLSLEIPDNYRHHIKGQLSPFFGFHETEQQHDILRLNLGRRPTELDPARASITLEVHLIETIYNRLVAYDRGTRAISPELAHHWVYDEHTYTWTFYLRKDVRFHDGTRCTAEHVAQSITRLRTIKTCNWGVRDLTKIELPHESIIVFIFRRPVPWFLEFLATSYASVICVSEHTGLPNGTGPYRMSRFTDDQIVLTVHEHYFGLRAHLDRIELYFNHAFMGPMLPQHPTQWDEQHVGHIEHGARYAMFHLKADSPLQNIALRRGIVELLDGAQMCNDLRNGRVFPSHSFSPETSQSLVHNKSVIKSNQRIFSESKHIRPLVIYHLTYPHSLVDVNWIRRQFQKVGVQIICRSFHIDDIYKDTFAADADIVLLGEVFEQNRYLAFLSLFHNQASVIAKLLTPQQRQELMPLLLALRDETDHTKRESLMRQIELFMRAQSWIAFLYHVEKTRTFPSILQELTLSANGWPKFQELWIKR
ncbi:MAG: ABC transporter substrate-binding protein [Bacilli bacterium]